MFIDHLKSFSALVAACLLVVPAAAFLDPAQVRTKTINIPNGMEESMITIKDSWGPPLPDSIRLGEDAYRAAPVLVPGSSWLAYVSQSAIGSWIGSYAPMAFQTIDR
jgi:hypothetical protein